MNNYKQKTSCSVQTLEDITPILTSGQNEMQRFETYQRTKVSGQTANAKSRDTRAFR